MIVPKAKELGEGMVVYKHNRDILYKVFGLC